MKNSARKTSIKSGKISSKKAAPAKTGSSLVFDPKRIVVMYRPATPEAMRHARELASWLREQGFSVMAAPGQKLGPESRAIKDKALDRIDWVIVLGGDGTYLNAVRMLQGRPVPILGVNMGSLGFLTETRIGDLYKVVTLTLQNKMELKPRAILSVSIRRNNENVAEYVALNDAVIERGTTTHLINIAVYNQRHFVAEVKADALIVATPTGSTAYNLAAGGPILHPEARAIVMTPVCPHALTTRPLIFPDDQHLSFRVVTRNKKAILTVDGINCAEISPEDEITVVRSPRDHWVIRKPSHNFFSLLREKLKFGERN